MSSYAEESMQLGPSSCLQKECSQRVVTVQQVRYGAISKQMGLCSCLTQNKCSQMVVTRQQISSYGAISVQLGQVWASK